jgi:hypothetical protein
MGRKEEEGRTTRTPSRRIVAGILGRCPGSPARSAVERKRKDTAAFGDVRRVFLNETKRRGKGRRKGTNAKQVARLAYPVEVPPAPRQRAKVGVDRL